MKLKAVTLVELLIVVTLLGVIVMGAIAFDSVGRRFLGVTDRRTEALNEANFVLDHMSKSALTGIGTLDQPAIREVGGPTLLIRQDTNGNGVFEAAVDRTAAYAYDFATHTMTFCMANNGGVCIPATSQILSHHIWFVSIPEITNQTANIIITASSTPPGQPTQSVTAQTFIQVPGQSTQ